MKPRTPQGATPAPAPAPTPAPAPAPAPAAAKPAPKPAETKRREEEEEREERKPERKAVEKPKTSPVLPEPSVDFTPPTAAQREATKAAALAPQTTSKAEKAAATTSPSPPAAKIDPGGRETTAVYVPPEELEALKPYLTALARVDELRRQGKIGEQQSSFGGGYATPFLLTSFLSGEGSRRPAVRPVQVSPKQGRKPLTRRPYVSEVRMPTEEELDIRIVGAQKMQQVVRDREASMRQQEQNDQERKQLELQLTQLDPTKSVKEQETPIHRRLKEIARQQRQLAEQVAAQESTLREYGMTDQEIKSR